MDGHTDLTVLLDFLKCKTPLEKPLGTHDQKEEMVMHTERFTVEMPEKGASTSPLVLFMHMN